MLEPIPAVSPAVFTLNIQLFYVWTSEYKSETTENRAGKTVVLMLNQLQVQLQTSSIVKQPQNISLIQQSPFISNCMCLYFTSMLHFPQGLNVKS